LSMIEGEHINPVIFGNGSSNSPFCFSSSMSACAASKSIEMKCSAPCASCRGKSSSGREFRVRPSPKNLSPRCWHAEMSSAQPKPLRQPSQALISSAPPNRSPSPCLEWPLPRPRPSKHRLNPPPPQKNLLTRALQRPAGCSKPNAAPRGASRKLLRPRQHQCVVRNYPPQQNYCINSHYYGFIHLVRTGGEVIFLPGSNYLWHVGASKSCEARANADFILRHRAGRWVPL
jgi:hypothetical protein